MLKCFLIPLSLCWIAVQLPASTIISNLGNADPGTNSVTTDYTQLCGAGVTGIVGGLVDCSFVGPNAVSKAMGFSLPGGSNYTVDSLTLRLEFPTGQIGFNPLVQLYNNSAGAPGSPVLTFTDPLFTTGTLTNFNFLPASSFALQAGSTYWIVVSNAGGSAFEWRGQPAPGNTPTGIATHVGQLVSFSGVPPNASGPSVIQNFYALNGTAAPGTAIPEPATSTLILISGVGLLLLGRRYRS